MSPPLYHQVTVPSFGTTRSPLSDSCTQRTEQLRRTPLSSERRSASRPSKTTRPTNGGPVMCVELTKESNWKRCTPMLSPSIIFAGLGVGNYTARAFIADDADGVHRYHQKLETGFSVVGKKELAAHKAATQERVGRDANLPSLLEWARQERQHWEERAVVFNGETAGGRLVGSSTGNESDVLLLIGVKTAVVENFAFRQVLRETWASENTLPEKKKKKS